MNCKVTIIGYSIFLHFGVIAGVFNLSQVIKTVARGFKLTSEKEVKKVYWHDLQDT